MQGQRRTVVQWQQLMAEFEAGEQTAKAFCKSRGISTSNFFKRRRVTQPLMTGNAFVPARVATGAGTVLIQVEDVSIRCGGDASPVWLAQLVAALRP